jgi:hypothetical protein
MHLGKLRKLGGGYLKQYPRGDDLDARQQRPSSQKI